MTRINFYSAGDFTDIVYLNYGGFGSVSRAFLKAENRHVAIKAINRDHASIVSQYESGAFMHLDHSNVVKILGLVNNLSKSLVVMEYAENGDMSAMLFEKENDPEYNFRHLISWALQSSSALYYLHSRKICHRDVKPGNILLTSGYSIVKMCDLDLCKEYDKTMTRNRGTEHYIAPEVITTNAYGSACDVYSFAVTLCVMIGRRKPSTLFPICDGSIIQFSGCPRILHQTIIRSLSIDSSKRPTMEKINRVLSKINSIVNKTDPFGIIVMKNRDKKRLQYLRQVTRMMKNTSFEETINIYRNKLN